MKEEIRESILKMENYKSSFDGILADMWKIYYNMNGGSRF
jgi:hypothetical protein